MIGPGDDPIDGKSNVVRYYQRYYDEQARLRGDGSALEFERTRDIILRYLPKPPAGVLDVGGGPGIYSAWLAKLGYTVRLVDIVPKHIEQALALSSAEPQNAFSAEIGDATELHVPDSSQDMVLELGPLYHLIDRTRRIKALSEARRVLVNGGCTIAAAITRYASVFTGVIDNALDDVDFKPVFERDLIDGQHLPHIPRDFTTAHFHHPDELKHEMEEAGFANVETLAVEGPFWLLRDLDDRWRDATSRRQLLYALSKIEEEPSLMGASLHFVCVGRKLG